MDPHQQRKEKRRNWQHGNCAGLSSDELAALADLWECQSNKSNQEFIIYRERESIQRSIALSKGTALKCYAISSIRLRLERPVDRC